MRLNFLKARKEAKVKAEALKKPARIPEQLKKDKAAVDKLVGILRGRYPPRTTELHKYYDIIKI